MLLEGHNQA